MSTSPATQRPQAETVVDELGLASVSWRPHGRIRPTLSDVSLRIRPGERVLLVGASGSGKSTLLRAMAGLLDDSLGELTGLVAFGGRDPQDVPGRIGFLLQDPIHSLVAEYAGRDAAFGPENLALPRARVQTRAASALGEVGFPYDASHRSTELSGGETQRLALAGSLALEPRLLLLDEPTAMLDPASASTVRAAVQRTVDERALSAVVVEHRLDGWADWCDRLLVLDQDGRLVADGPVRDVLAEQRDALLAGGIWVPGAPEPAPIDLDLPPFPSAPGRARTGPVIRAEQLGVGAPGGGRTLISGLDLSLDAGAALALTGPSGAGKSTLLATLTGLRPPAAGVVRVRRSDDHELTDVTRLARSSVQLAGSVGLVAQHAERMITRRTVAEEVMATSRRLFADRPELLDLAQNRADTAIRALGLEQLREADPFQISGGEQRRTALAAVIVHAPALLTADEPTVGQDRHTWAAVQAVLAAARRDGSAVLVSTHDQLLVERLGRRLDLGRPEVAPGDPDHRIRPVIEPGSPPAARCNPLAVLLTGLGAVVGSFMIDNWLVGLVGLAVIAGLAPLAVRRPRTLVRLVPVGLAALTVGWSSLLFGPGGWQPDRWPVAVRESLRICYLVIPGALLMASLRPSTLADALGQRLRLPHRVVAAGASGLLRLDSLFDEWRELGEIRLVRGLAAGRSQVQRARQLASMTLALLVSMLRSAQQMAISMDARGFAASQRRSYALTSPWRSRDWLCVLIGVLLAALPALITILSGR